MFSYHRVFRSNHSIDVIQSHLNGMKLRRTGIGYYVQRAAGIPHLEVVVIPVDADKTNIRLEQFFRLESVGDLEFGNAIGNVRRVDANSSDVELKIDFSDFTRWVLIFAFAIGMIGALISAISGEWSHLSTVLSFIVVAALYIVGMAHLRLFWAIVRIFSPFGGVPIESNDQQEVQHDR